MVWGGRLRPPLPAAARSRWHGMAVVFILVLIDPTGYCISLELKPASDCNKKTCAALFYSLVQRSVSVYHTLVLTQNYKRKIMRFSQSGSPGVLVFWHQRSHVPYVPGDPLRGYEVQTRLGWTKNDEFSSNKSLYLGNARR